MSTTDTNDAAPQDGGEVQDQVQNPRHPQWRSRVDRMPELARFEDLYIRGDKVRVDGPRGLSRVYIIAEALGNGVYRLQDGPQVNERALRRERSASRPAR